MKSLKNYNSKGFTLVEIMVVVAIIAILSGTAMVGWNSLRETITLEQSGEILKDIVKKTEMEILQNEYEKVTLHFKEDYLLIVAEPEDYDLELINAICGDDIGLTSADGGILKKRNERVLVSIVNLVATDDVCWELADMTNREWNYQLFSVSEDEVSPIISFIHYNPSMDGVQITVTTGVDSYLVIEGPYISKEYHGLISGQINITLDDGDNDVDITIQ